MKLKKEFVTVPDNKEAITVSTDTKLFSGMVRSNETAAFIIQCLEKETTVDEIVEKMSEQYDADLKVLKDDVEKVIDQLRSINALHE